LRNKTEKANENGRSIIDDGGRPGFQSRGSRNPLRFRRVAGVSSNSGRLVSRSGI
jgi:hypothetical protein